MLPPISVPKPTIDPRMAIKAPSPPVLPPAVHLRLRGFSVRPKRWLQLSNVASVCGMFVFAITTAPRDSSRSTSGAFASAGLNARADNPMVESTPFILNESFNDTGSPCKGPIGVPVRSKWSSSSRARCKARSNRGSVRQRVS